MKKPNEYRKTRKRCTERDEVKRSARTMKGEVDNRRATYFSRRRAKQTLEALVAINLLPCNE